MIIAAFPRFFILKQPSVGARRYIQGMDTITNKEVQVYLDNDEGTLKLTGLLVSTLVFLYDSQGDIMGKYMYVSPSITVTVPKPGMYVLVMSHPNCQPEVRRIMYKGDINNS